MLLIQNMENKKAYGRISRNVKNPILFLKDANTYSCKTKTMLAYYYDIVKDSIKELC